MSEGCTPTPQELEFLKRKYGLSQDVIRKSMGMGAPPAPPQLPEAQYEAIKEAARLKLRPSTEESELNETEKRYLAWLRTLDDHWIGIQCITLKLAFRLRYTPDFWALDSHGLRAIDTKGPHVWEDSIVKIKIASRLFPMFRFLLAKEENHQWKHQEIKP